MVQALVPQVLQVPVLLHLLPHELLSRHLQDLHQPYQCRQLQLQAHPLWLVAAAGRQSLTGRLLVTSLQEEGAGGDFEALQ
jgi:hypothetical protein